MNKIQKSTLFVFFMTILVSGSLYAQTEISETEPAQYFDFWIGSWDLTWKEANGNTGRGINHIERIMDDTVIMENFEIIEGNNKGFEGKSMSIYQDRRNQWKQAWADNSGAFYDFTGIFEDGKRIFQTEIIELPDGREYTQRMVFHNIQENSFT